jgi:predicted transcriptional regulator
MITLPGRMSISITAGQKRRLTRAAKDLTVSESAIVRMALTKFFNEITRTELDELEERLAANDGE